MFIRKQVNVLMPAQFAESLNSAFSTFQDSPSNSESEFKSADNIFRMTDTFQSNKSCIRFEITSFTPLWAEKVVDISYVDSVVYVPPVGETNGTFTVSGSGLTVVVPVSLEAM